MKTLTTTLLVLCSLFCKGQDSTSHLYTGHISGLKIIGDSLAYNKPDTVKCVMVVTDIENKSSMVYAVYGYYVTKHNLEQLVYLDERKKVLNKIIVWMAKEIK